MTEHLSRFADLYRKQGPWCIAYVDASAGGAEGAEAAEVRPGDVRAALAQQGASAEDLEAMEAAVDPARGLPAPISRFVLVRQGTVELNELLPGPLVMPKYVSVGLVPDLLPLIKHRPEEFPYVVAEATREGAEIRLEYVARPGPAAVKDISGSTEDISKLSGGEGWGQDKQQRRTEETWRRNAGEVAGQIDRIVDSSGARLIVLAGDVRARGLVQDQLAEAHKPLVTTIDSEPRPEDSHQQMFQDKVQERIALQWAAEQEQIMDRLALQEGQANPESAVGAGAVVHALQQAQVDVLILNDKALSDRQLLALASEPWVATAEEQALGAEPLGRVPATTALLRAAALTDASLLLVPGGVLPGGVEMAALLRWPTGPAAPGANAT